MLCVLNFHPSIGRPHFHVLVHIVFLPTDKLKVDNIDYMSYNTLTPSVAHGVNCTKKSHYCFESVFQFFRINDFLSLYGYVHLVKMTILCALEKLFYILQFCKPADVSKNELKCCNYTSNNIINN